MKGSNYYLVVFKSKNHAMLLYTLLESKNYDFMKLISTPCNLKAGCSYSMKVLDKSHLETIKQEADGAHIKNLKLYYVEKINGRPHYKEIPFS